MAVSAPSDGASHLRRRATQRVNPAKSKANSGKHTSECVTLRCQVRIKSWSCENKSRKASASGTTAPSIHDQVTRCRRFIGCGGNNGAPLQRALLSKAPARPCVMVSTAEVYRSAAQNPRARPLDLAESTRPGPPNHMLIFLTY